MNKSRPRPGTPAGRASSRASAASYPNAGSLAAGGSAGGLFAYVFDTYTDPPIRDMLLYLAPTFAILASAAFTMIAQWVARVKADHELRAELRKAATPISIGSRMTL